MKKLLDSDWLRAVQFSCNTSANYKQMRTKTTTGVFARETAVKHLKIVLRNQIQLLAPHSD